MAPVYNTIEDKIGKEDIMTVLKLIHNKKLTMKKVSKEVFFSYLAASPGIQEINKKRMEELVVIHYWRKKDPMSFYEDRILQKIGCIIYEKKFLFFRGPKTYYICEYD